MAKDIPLKAENKDKNKNKNEDDNDNGEQKGKVVVEEGVEGEEEEILLQGGDGAAGEGGAVGEPKRSKHARKSKKEKVMKRYVEYSIPRDVVKRLIRELTYAILEEKVSKLQDSVLFDKDAMQALHLSAEKYVVDLFKVSSRMMDLHGRNTLSLHTLRASVDIQRFLSSTMSH